MHSERIATGTASRHIRTPRAVLLSKFGLILYYLFVTITTLAVFIPFNPRMPATGLDASWEFAMNQAVTRHLSFGKQVVFTYGPYASVGTRVFDPETDRRMMLGSLLLAVCYLAALFYLSRGQKRYLIVILLLFLATFGSPELLLLSYSFLLVVCTLKQIDSPDHDRGLALKWWQVLMLLAMWSTLGLLPVVKGSLLLPFAASVVIPPFFLLNRRRYRQAILLLLVPITASVSFWAFAGQPLADIPAFLHGTFALTSGYTEAMSTSWAVLPSAIGDGLVIAYLGISGLICLSISCCSGLTLPSKWMLMLLSAVFLLVAFKHGFIASSAIAGSFGALSVLILIIGLLYIDRYLVCSLSIAMVLTSVTSLTREPVLGKEVRDKFGVGAAWTGGEGRRDILAFCEQRAVGAYARLTYKTTWNTYTSAWQGLRSRLSRNNDLENEYDRSLSSIRGAYALPALKGSADIYEYDQSVLLASNNEWNPRPVIQSYSAYTPGLARLNEQHLRSSDAPEWVLFDLQSIDNRFPSLDDGMSWPALFDNYTFNSHKGQFVLLAKKQIIKAHSNYIGLVRRTCKTGETIPIPESHGVLFAEVDLKPTLAGRLLIALFNPPLLHMVVRLDNGEVKSYRVVSEMMTTGFLLSPLVSNDGEFASIVAGDTGLADGAKVESISIAPSYGGSVYWSGEYELTLKEYVSE